MITHETLAEALRNCGYHLGHEPQVYIPCTQDHMMRTLADELNKMEDKK